MLDADDRFGAAMNKTEKSSAVRKAAQGLRAIALKREVGEMLGSEDELLAQLQVSRPTLRQAAGLVAQEQLLSVRRGVGGGYFAQRPDTTAVAHMAAIYLQTNDARLEDVIRAVAPIRIELARLATRNRDPALRAELKDFVRRERERDNDALQYRVFLKGEREFAQILASLGANKALSLFLAILYDYASMISREEDLYVNRPERIEEYRSKRNRMAEAILDGDEDVAVLAATRCTMNVTEWMVEDLRRRVDTAAKTRTSKRPRKTRD